jgi:hypothetical protein
VERYFGRAVALNAANTLEYQGQGWLDPASNMVYAKRRKSTAQHPPVLSAKWMSIRRPRRRRSIGAGPTTSLHGFSPEDFRRQSGQIFRLSFLLAGPDSRVV